MKNLTSLPTTFHHSGLKQLFIRTSETFTNFFFPLEAYVKQCLMVVAIFRFMIGTKHTNLDLNSSVEFRKNLFKHFPIESPYINKGCGHHVFYTRTKYTSIFMVLSIITYIQCKNSINCAPLGQTSQIK
jgi:hypothetical protein